jgi:pyruvate,orthophosphate dikinase
MLMRLGTDLGRAARPGLKVGICGEHGGDPASVEFCHELGFDYVSCSPYRVPIARLAAAQASLRERGAKAARPKGTGAKGTPSKGARAKGARSKGTRAARRR